MGICLSWPHADSEKRRCCDVRLLPNAARTVSVNELRASGPCSFNSLSTSFAAGGKCTVRTRGTRSLFRDRIQLWSNRTSEGLDLSFFSIALG